MKNPLKEFNARITFWRNLIPGGRSSVKKWIDYDNEDPPAARTNGILIHFPQIRRQDAQFVAIFGDGAASDGDAFFREHFYDFLVG